MVECLTNTLMVVAAGRIGGMRTESSIATGGRIKSIVERVVTIVCNPVLLETDIYRI